MNCVPPWLSAKKNCLSNIIMYNHTRMEVADMIDKKFVNPKEDLKHTEAEERCKNPCRKMTNTLSLISLTEFNHKFSTKLEFRFKKTVKVEKKVVVYTWFSFIIDAGSSLGLWLGLSALGITDLAIEAYSWIIKWARNVFAFTKD